MTDGDVVVLLLVTGIDGSSADICGGLIVAASLREAMPDSPDVFELLLSLAEAVLFLVATGSVVKSDAMLKKSSFIFLTSS